MGFMGAGNANNFIPRSNGTPGSGGNSAPSGRTSGSWMPSGNRTTVSNSDPGKRSRAVKTKGRRSKVRTSGGGAASRGTAPSGTTSNINTRGGSAVAKGLGGVAATHATKGGLKKFLSKANPWVAAALLFTDILLADQGLEANDSPEYWRNPGESEVIEEGVLPFRGGQMEGVKYWVRAEVDLYDYRGYFHQRRIEGPIDVYGPVGGVTVSNEANRDSPSATAVYLDVQGKNVYGNDIVKSKFVAGSGFTGELIRTWTERSDGKPDTGGDPEPKGEIKTESTINNDNAEITTDINSFPSNTRPPFPSNRTASPPPSKNYNREPAKPPVVKQATTKTPKGGVESNTSNGSSNDTSNGSSNDTERPKIENPTETPEPIPAPEPPTEKTIEEQEQEDSTETEEPDVISKTKVKRADGTTEIITRREATEEELEQYNKDINDAKRELEDAQEVIEQDKRYRFNRTYYPELDEDTESDQNTNDSGGEKKETERKPAGNIDWNINPPPSQTENTNQEPPEPDGEPEDPPPIIPPPINQAPSSGCQGCSRAILNRLDGLQLGLQGLDLLMLREVHQTVHSPKHGLAKIQSFAETAWKATKADKVMAGVSMMMTIHNGMMLSNNLLSTVSEALNMSLNALNIRDETDTPIDIGAAIGDKIEGLIKTLIGTEGYAALTAKIVRANRIYQAGINVLDTTYSLFDSARSVAELTAENTGKIGNALRESGAVYEDAYEEFLENVNPQNASMKRLDKFREGSEDVENVFSTISQVSSDVVEFQENVEQLKSEKKELAAEINKAIATEIELKEQEKQEATTSADIQEDAFDSSQEINSRQNE